MIKFFILMGVLVLTIGMIYLLNLKFNILKYFIKKIIFNTGGKEYGYYVSKKFLTEHRGKI